MLLVKDRIKLVTYPKEVKAAAAEPRAVTVNRIDFTKGSQKYKRLREKAFGKQKRKISSSVRNSFDLRPSVPQNFMAKAPNPLYQTFSKPLAL